MSTNVELLSAARSWLGVRFVHQGRTRFGVDCIGFVLCALKECGINYVDTEPRNYRRNPQELLITRINSYGCEKIDEPRDGCLIVIKWPLQKYPSHVALYGSGNIIHSYQQVGRVIETGYRAQWLRWTNGLYLIPGISYE